MLKLDLPSGPVVGYRLIPQNPSSDHYKAPAEVVSAGRTRGLHRRPPRPKCWSTHNRACLKSPLSCSGMQHTMHDVAVMHDVVDR